MPLLNIHQNSYCLQDALSIGVYLDPTNNHAILIDSGIDDSKIKSVQKSLPNGYQISAIINTHSHADHCGGNAYVQKKNPAVRIFTTKFEQGFVEVPSHEPHGFNCLAEPFSELKNKYLCAEPSRVTDIIDYRDHKINVNGLLFRVVTLPGHSAGMIGVITPDNVFYCGDAAFGADTFQKHGVLFYSNIPDTLASLTKMKQMVTQEALNGFVFYHGGPELVQKVPAILDAHAQKVLATQDLIKIAIEEKSRSMDELTGLVMTHFNVPNNIVQFSLTQTCVRAYVASLQRAKVVELFMNQGRTMEARLVQNASSCTAAAAEEIHSPCCGK